MSDLLGHNNPPKRKLKTDLDVAVFHMLKLDKENQVLQSRLADAEVLIEELATWVFGTVSQLGFEELQAKIKAFKKGKHGRD